jgi:hypothetical protein
MTIKIEPSLIFILIFAFVSQAFAQTPRTENIALKGTVIDKETNLPLSYVSVGIFDKPEGTVTDTTGNFLFSVHQENLSDTLQISIVGYNSLRVSVKDFLVNPDKSIKLTKRAEQLAEVTVTNSVTRAHTEIIGRQAVSKLVQVSVHNKKSADETVGSEMGMRYKANKKKAFLKDFNFYISANNFNYIKFRVNIYSLRNDLPDTLLYSKQIFSTVENYKTGWIKVDLETCNIKIKDEFIVTIQWIESRMDKKENPLTILPVAATPFSKNCYARIASQDKWKRMGVHLSSFVTIAY